MRGKKQFGAEKGGEEEFGTSSKSAVKESHSQQHEVKRYTSPAPQSAILLYSSHKYWYWFKDGRREHWQNNHHNVCSCQRGRTMT
jgi:hypothetical protein